MAVEGTAEGAREMRARDDRVELLLDGDVVALLEFRDDGDVRAITHTETAPAYRGRGLAAELVASVLADLHVRGKRLLPVCPYVAAYLRRHPEEIALVPAGRRAEFRLPPAPADPGGPNDSQEL